VRDYISPEKDLGHSDKHGKQGKADKKEEKEEEEGLHATQKREDCLTCP